MTTDNLRIWNALRKTDPKHTKGFQRAGGFRGTAIKPIYMTQKMTELFGPCGSGWGMGKPEFTTMPVADEVLVFCTVDVWYKTAPDDVASGVWGVGGDKAVVKRNNGQLIADDEAFKKAYTDALSNAMKQIGVGADVHMGQFEDAKYLDELKREFAEKPVADDNDPKAAAYRIKDAIDNAETLESLNAIMKAQGRTLEAIKAASQPAYESLMDRAEKRRMAFAGSPTQRMAS